MSPEFRAGERVTPPADETCIDCGLVTQTGGYDMGEVWADTEFGSHPQTDDDGRPVYACLDIAACDARQATFD